MISAWYVKEFNPDAQVTIFEADKKGGQISTEEYKGVLLEKGPAFFLLENPVLHYALSRCSPGGLQLCKNEKAHILKDGYYQKAPGGFMEFENNHFSFLSGGVSSFFGMKKKASIWDSVSFFDFLKSTYGLNYAVSLGSAFARNIYFCEAENLNFRAAYPELYNELRKGLSLKETLQKFSADSASFWQNELGGKLSKESKSSFVAGIYYYKGGLGKLIDDLAEDLKNKNCTIEFAKIHDITAHKGEYTLHSRKNKYGAFQKIISSAGAHEQAVYWKNLHKDLSFKLAELKYLPVSTVYSAYNFKDFNRAGLGFFASRKEKLTISGAFYMNALNKDIEKINQFVTRTILPGDLSLFSDQELMDLQANDFEKVFSLKIRPLWSKVFRHESGGPLLDNNYMPWKNSIGELLKDEPSIQLIGSDMASGDINRSLEDAYKAAKNLC